MPGISSAAWRRAPQLLVRQQRVTVGSVEDLQAMADAITANRMQPVVDRTFAFAEAKAAFVHMASGAHFGKVAIAIP
jgi:NADPH:quinone reductase-like Zn-dependent oxidoreductase